ncbi:MAG: hypothetical protein CM15mP115_13940 [Alphaproteobacteria bacterium]|nr:MAG: hypothetical protein CM15mP115_13940 [Alphaproteobacteria bacterium]
MWDFVIQLYIRFQETGCFGKPHSSVTDQRNQPPQIIVCTATCLLYQTEMRVGKGRRFVTSFLSGMNVCAKALSQDSPYS